MKKIIASLFVAAMMLAEANAVTISGVKAQQRYPWNNLVDVDFTLTAPAGEAYRVELQAKQLSSGKVFAANSYASDPVAKSGSNRVTWDFGADYPNFKASDMSFAVAVAPYSDSSAPLYVVIDLSAGPDATKYPIRYVTQAPEHMQGAVNEKCQTTELWLRRVKKTTQPELFFGFTEPSNETSGQYWG